MRLTCFDIFIFDNDYPFVLLTSLSSGFQTDWGDIFSCLIVFTSLLTVEFQFQVQGQSRCYVLNMVGHMVNISLHKDLFCCKIVFLLSIPINN